MLEPGRDFNLTLEALGPDRRGHLGSEYLDGDLTAVFGVLGQEDDGRAARTPLSLDHIPIGQGSPDLVDEVYHRFDAAFALKSRQT